MPKIRTHEGDWFAVPLTPHGYALGVAARVGKRGMVLGYFFGPLHEQVPTIADRAGLTAADAVMVRMFGDLGIWRGEWPLLGKAEGWSRDDWPIPLFGRHDRLVDGVRYMEAMRYPDALMAPSSILVPFPEGRELPQDGLAGAKFMELVLSDLLIEGKEPFRPW